MTDGKEQQVWVTSSAHRGSRHQRKLHTDPDCPTLTAAQSVSGPKPRSVFNDDREICKKCRGVIEQHNPGRSDAWKLLSDPDFGPEDLGLTGGDA